MGGIMPWNTQYKPHKYLYRVYWNIRTEKLPFETNQNKWQREKCSVKLEPNLRRNLQPRYYLWINYKIDLLPLLVTLDRGVRSLPNFAWWVQQFTWKQRATSKKLGFWILTTLLVGIPIGGVRRPLTLSEWNLLLKLNFVCTNLLELLRKCSQIVSSHKLVITM